MHAFSREEMLIGPEGLEKLRSARAAVFGLGGVGGTAAEALARSGVGSIDLIDSDRYTLTNLNRQLGALHSTLGRDKADVMAERLRDINPDLIVTPRILFYLPGNAEEIDLSAYDIILDCIDTVAAKLTLIERAYRLTVPVISAMGAGNRTDPTRLRIGDLFSTRDDPLAREMRRELRRRGVPALPVVYSLEPPRRPAPPPPEQPADPAAPRRDIPGSTAFVPPAMGLAMAYAAVRELLKNTVPDMNSEEPRHE